MCCVIFKNCWLLFQFSILPPPILQILNLKLEDSFYGFCMFYIISEISLLLNSKDSICNEDQTDGDIGDMGKRLAEEVRNFISDLVGEKEI